MLKEIQISEIQFSIFKFFSSFLLYRTYHPFLNRWDILGNHRLDLVDCMIYRLRLDYYHTYLVTFAFSRPRRWRNIQTFLIVSLLLWVAVWDPCRFLGVLSLLPTWYGMISWRLIRWIYSNSFLEALSSSWLCVWGGGYVPIPR